MPQAQTNFATLARYAQLAFAAYNNGVNLGIPGDFIPSGWRFLSPSEIGMVQLLTLPSGVTDWAEAGNFVRQDQRGFFISPGGSNALFFAINETTHQIAAVFRGTDDFGNDFFTSYPGIGTDDLNSQIDDFRAALNAVVRYVNTAASAAYNYELVAIGHSLGGALAASLLEYSTYFHSGYGFGAPAMSLADPIADRFLNISHNTDWVGTLFNAMHETVPWQLLSPQYYLAETLYDGWSNASFDNRSAGQRVNLIDNSWGVENGPGLNAHSRSNYASELALLGYSEAFGTLDPWTTPRIYIANGAASFFGLVPTGEFAFVGTSFGDEISGAARFDFLRIEGGAGNDIIYGGSGGNVLSGGNGVDTLYGGTGTDSLFGGSAGDTLYGISGNDSLSGGAGDDTLYGGQGEDYLQGGSGNDLLTGGRGDDHYSIGLSEGADIINEAGDGNGTDTINLYVGSAFSAFDFGWFSRDGNDLLIRADNNSGVRIVDIRIAGAGNAVNAVENIDLFVGDAATASQLWSLTNIWQQLTGAPPSGGSSSNPGGSGGTVVGGTSNGFSDDFNRSDGTIGNGWVANAASGSNSLQILNGRVTATPIANVGQTTQMLHAADFSSNVRVTADLFGTFDPSTGLNNQYLTSIFFGGTGSLTNSLGIEIRSQGSVASGAQISLYRGNGTGNGPGTIIFTHAPLASQIHVDVGYTAEGAIIGSITSGGQRFEFNFEAGFARPSGNNIVISQSIPAGISTPAIDNVSITNGALPGIDLNEQTYARSLAINATLTGTINAPWDKDWFAVDLVAGTAYRFQLRGADSGGGTLADPFLRLRDANGNSITYNEDSGPDGHDSLLFFVAPTTGRYYLSVGGDLATGGTYTVGIQNAGSAASGIATYGDQFSNNLVGTDYADNLSGGGGDDYLAGGAGNDQLWGDSGGGPIGNDILIGGEGDDRLESSGGTDMLDGSAGRDFLYFARFGAGLGIRYNADEAASAEGLILGDGTVIRNIETVTLGLGNGNDDVTLHIGARPNVEDVVSLNGGDDRLTAGGGAVNANGGAGNDTLVLDFRWSSSPISQLPAGFEPMIFGPPANEMSSNYVRWAEFERLIFFGGAAGDTIQQATAGDDQLYGYGGNDSLASGAGNDQLFGGDGDDQLNPGIGIDEVDGGSGNDRLVLDRSLVTENISINVDAMSTTLGVTLADGTLIRNIETLDIILGNGDDIVETHVNAVAPATNFGGSGLVDRVNTGSGDDLITIGGGSDYVDGGAGVDTVIMDFRWSERPLEGSGTPPPFAAFGFRDNYGSNITTLNVESFIIYGGSGNDNVTLGNGNGTIFGGLGDDTLTGLSGNDLLNGGLGADTLNGGDGFDTASYAGSSAAVTINLATSSYSGGDADGDTLIGIEAIIGSAFADSLTGNVGDDVLDGGGGSDALYGDAGNDRLILGAGAAGAIIDGGVGTDTLVVTANTTLASLVAIEALELAGGANLILTGTQFSTGLARNTAVSGNGTITVNMDVGTPLVSTPFAFAGTDVSFVVNGTSGFDIIKLGNSTRNVANGGDGVDQIRGGQLTDTINGGDGNDKIMGSGGADILTGGAGNDQFRYLLTTDSGPGANADRITDFTIGSDRLNLTAIDTNPLVAGVQGFAFIGNSAFHGMGAAQVRYGNSGADLLVQADVNGDGIADMEIILQGIAGQALSAADFMMAAAAEQPVFKGENVVDVSTAFFEESAFIDGGGRFFRDLINLDQALIRPEYRYIEQFYI